MNLKSFKRKQIIISPAELTKTEFLQSEQTLPLVIKPTIDGINLTNWASNSKAWIEAQLLQYGGLIFRNFNIHEIDGITDFIQAISGELIEYSYRSTPRSQISGKIYTSTEYPAEQSIPLHNEMAYSLNWPMKICFFCVKTAEKGGETPIADSRKIFQNIPSRIKEKFIENKIMYVRNYGQGLDLQWENVFQTTNKSEVENYCRQTGIEFEWKDDNNLRTRQVCQAVASHPKTGEMVWFNQAHLFHISSLHSEVRASLLKMLDAKDLPRNAFYGDGSEIETSVIEEINAIYQQQAVVFPWEEGDILMLDNMLVAHGRRPFVGKRKVVVGMAEPFSGQ
ncbi:TauD/TfdA family dioxygenase [Nodularia sp. UHCC 0506]|uniref:TauD/TfdA family dioxygenase n=1 Tax=Nodularia sp. UHCC 0506 TaxID=3110243 RepID=UPI002B1FFE63|nr:TauD/TfdA family dioxygenase [Nodularia sp. UHCC 0506]MEA5516076.1 TauD/TfdA family dioxygenase [Nodularia sp. UHCC 0506]